MTQNKDDSSTVTEPESVDNIAEYPHTVEEVPLKDLVVIAPQLQRALRARRVNTIMRSFNPNALGQSTVSRRRDGSNVLLDGQHRREAMLKRLTMGLPTPDRIECKVFTGLTVEQEAQLFLDLNETSRPSFIDRYGPRVTAGGDSSVEVIQAALSKWNWIIDGSVGTGKIAAVAALEWVWKEGVRIDQRNQLQVDLVDLVLQVITTAWGHQPAGVRGPILQGVAALLAENVTNPNLSLKRFTAKLAQYPGGPTALLASASANARIRQLSPAMGVADLLTMTYNSGTQTNSLPAWTRRK